MKVLLVAPQSRDTVLGEIGTYCKKAIKNLGYELEVFDFRESQYLKGPIGASLKKGIKKMLPFPPWHIPLVNHMERIKMNRSLLIAAEEYRPDILFILTGDNILPGTLMKIRKSDSIIVNWFTDSVLAPMRRDFIDEVSSCYYYFFTVEAEEIFKYIKVKAAHIKTVPLGCDPEVHRSIDLSEEEKKEYGSDIAFVGTIKSGREKILAKLADFDLSIWGYWQKKIPELRRCYCKQHIYGEDVCKIYNASKIVVDIPVSYSEQGLVFMISLRVFEISACGTFALSVKTPYISNLYDIGKEMVYYKDVNELKELVKYYLDHPEERESIAKKAQERAYRDHTYEKRLKEIFSIIKKNG